MPTVLLVGEGKHELGGALRNLVDRLSTASWEYHERNIRDRERVHRGRGDGYEKVAMHWMRIAHKEGYDALVLLIDQDGFPERTRQFAAAQEIETFPVARALGVAIRTFDAWMLADERALSVVLGCTVPRQPAPETINSPKESCCDLLANTPIPLTQTQLYSEIAKVADLAVLVDRCPKGFAPFAQRVRAISFRRNDAPS